LDIRARITAYYKAHKNEAHMAALSVFAVLIVGSLLSFTKAASFFTSTEAETGTLSSPATQVTDTSASGGSAVKFGNGGGGTNPLSSLPLIPWAGGPSYYSKFPFAKAHGWDSPNFFPIAAWFMRASDQGSQDLYKSMHFNTTIHVEEESDLATLKQNGFGALPGDPSWGVGDESIGWIYADETDMKYGAGSDAWNGIEQWNSCIPTQDEGGKCGFTYLNTWVPQYPSNDGRMGYINLGKDIFPGWEEPSVFAGFINGGWTDFISDDIYWYTDNDT
jgi:hypothetical protein